MDKIKEGLYKKSPGIKKFVVLEFSKYQLKTYARTKKNKEKAESLKTWYYLDDRTIKEQGKNKTVLFSSHILQEVEAICDRIIIISKGQIVADDKLENLRKGQSLEEFFRSLTSALVS